MRSDARIIITCDACNVEETEVFLTISTEPSDLGTELWETAYVEGELQNQGWEVVNGKDTCPECIIR